MPISCEKFLLSAQTLLEGFEEVDYRNAASRAYYTAYHVCLTVANAAMLPDTSTSGGCHKRLIWRLTHSKNRKHKFLHMTLGYMLNVILFDRISADYEINDDFSKNKAEVVVTHAKRIIKEAATILP
jgi:uncharacterized protein (UPF0332 family)